MTCRCGQQKPCTPLASLVSLGLGGSPSVADQAAGRPVGGKSPPISPGTADEVAHARCRSPLSGLTVPNRCRPAPQAMRPGPSGGLEVLVGRANWLPAPRRTAPARQGSDGRALRERRITHSTDPRSTRSSTPLDEASPFSPSRLSTTCQTLAVERTVQLGPFDYRCVHRPRFAGPGCSVPSERAHCQRGE